MRANQLILDETYRCNVKLGHVKLFGYERVGSGQLEIRRNRTFHSLSLAFVRYPTHLLHELFADFDAFMLRPIDRFLQVKTAFNAFG